MTFFALHPNLLIGHLLHPVRRRPLTGSVDIYQCFQIPAPSSLFTSSLRLFYIIHLSSSDLCPCSRFKALPRTPSTTDDEHSLPSPQFNPHRAAIRPLVIAKHNTRWAHHFCVTPPAVQELHQKTHPALPLIPMRIMVLRTWIREGESDSEWYTRESSKILILHSPLPTTQSPLRPESIFVPRYSIRYSKPLLLTPSSPLSPAFPPAGEQQIPNYLPSPVPRLVHSSFTSSSLISPFMTWTTSLAPNSFHSPAPHPRFVLIS